LTIALFSFSRCTSSWPSDLRFVLAVSRINNDLERIGDQAVNIAQAPCASFATRA